MSSEYENAIKGFDFYKLNHFDILLILLFILMSLGFFLFSSMGLDWRLTRGAEGIIFHNGRQLHAVDMSKNGTFPILDGKMTLEIKNGKIRVVQSDCPHQICIKNGWIETPGQITVCVPNKILIKIDSPHESYLDAVVQ